VVTVVYTVLSVVLGVLAAVHHGSALDYALRTIALAGVGLPAFWWACCCKLPSTKTSDGCPRPDALIRSCL